MKYFLILIFSMISAPSFAESKPTVGKVESYVCHSPTRQRLGSGSVVSIANNFYVITSSHVVYHGNEADGICATFHANNQKYRISPVAINILNGLALFRLDGQAAAGVVPAYWENMQSNLNTPLPNAACLAGVPFAASSLPSNCAALILDSNSTRSILPAVSTVIEVDGHSEFGMSGGGLFDDRGQYRGLVSHQYLSPEAGRQAVYKSYDAGVPTGQLIALAIPLTVVVPWIQKTMDRDPSANVVEVVSEQKENRITASFEGIRFAERICSHAGGGIGGQGIGIGGTNQRDGGQGIGIGGTQQRGGQGVGIGGSAQLPTRCYLELTLDPAGFKATQPWPFTRSAPKWLLEAKHKLLAKEHVWLEGFEDQGQPVTISSLMTALTRLARGEAPIIRMSHEQLGNIDANATRVIEGGQAITKLVTQIRETKNLSESTIELLNELSILGIRAQGQQFSLISSAVLERLCSTSGADAARWTELLASFDTKLQDSALELKSRVLRLRRDFAAIQINHSSQPSEGN